MNQTGNTVQSTRIVKFLYSYGGRIIPRRPDGELRYIGGFTRVLSVDRSISFSELMVKFGELCGSCMSLRCKLPTEEMDVLVSITCDEDLTNLIEEYDRVTALTETKIRALLSPNNLPKMISPPSSPISCLDFPAKVGRFDSPPSYAASPALGYPVVGKGGQEVYHPHYGHGSVRPPPYYFVPHNYQ